jgi:hypothetical protein
MAATSPVPQIYIIGEDTDRMRPLLEVLSSRGVSTVVWDTAGGCLVPTLAPPSLAAVYFCRQSPSAGGRGHPHAMGYAKELLRWLEFHGATVVNGSRALDVECSKGLQMMYLHAAGLNVPLTMVQQGLRQTVVQAMAVPEYREGAFIMKPNQGGSGANVDSYANGRELRNDVRGSGGGILPAPDDLWVLQTHVGTYSRDPLVTKSILRFEVIGGVVQRDYVVQITAPSTEFSLCPCDPRAEKLLNSIDFRILRNPLTIPGFKDAPEAFDAFCTKVEQVFAWVGASVGSVEGIVEEDPEVRAGYPCPHEPVLFEMNFNTNYNSSAEAAAGITPGPHRVADLLLGELLRLTDTGTGSAAPRSGRSLDHDVGGEPGADKASEGGDW